MLDLDATDDDITEFLAETVHERNRLAAQIGEYREFSVVLAEVGDDYWREIYDASLESKGGSCEKAVRLGLKIWLEKREQVCPEDRERFDNEALSDLSNTFPSRCQSLLQQRLAICLRKLYPNRVIFPGGIPKATRDV
jgi:hypothetical protein